MILGAREPPNVVYQTYFKLFVLWFGPISDKNGIEVLEFVKTLLQQEWFFGILPEEQAIEKINTHGKAGCYLVRFSSKQACFTLTYLDLKKTKIRSIRVGERESMVIISFIRATVKRQKLKKPVPGSKYQVLFVKQPAHRMGYFPYDANRNKKKKKGGKDDHRENIQDVVTTPKSIIYIP